jgi:hypothetical protein
MIHNVSEARAIIRMKERRYGWSQYPFRRKRRYQAFNAHWSALRLYIGIHFE